MRQWRKRGVAIESSELNAILARIVARLGLKQRFDLLESASAVVPAVIGWIKPALIVPTSLLSGLTPTELESLLAHELAHIRRHDYLVNLIQTVIETLLFYHPAVWWLSGIVRYERENCCDDLAVEACGSKLDFVRALAKMEALRCGEPDLALSARGGSLLRRVERLIAVETARQTRWPAGVATLFSVAILATGIGLATSIDEPFSRDLSGAIDSYPIPAEATNDDKFEKHQPEIKVVDAVTGQMHEVLSGVILSNGKLATQLDMKYSNVMPYSFVPARIAKELGATDLGEIDFGDQAPKREPIQQTIRSAVLSELIPQPRAGQPADDKDSLPGGRTVAATEWVYVDDLKGPAFNRKIVPYELAPIWVPDHLAFYGVNQKQQKKFRVVRIERVNLGLGPQFGPVNALVLDDANTSLGVLGSNWSRIPRGPEGETFVHSAVEGFWFMKLPMEDRKAKPDGPASAEKMDEEKVRPVRRDGEHVILAAMESQRAGRSPVELMKRHAEAIVRHGKQSEQLDNARVTDQETLFSAQNPKMFPWTPEQLTGGMDADEMIFNLPEGSGVRAEFAGEKVEINSTESGTIVVVTNGCIKLFDSNGVVRINASPDGGAEQLIADVRTINREGVLRMTTRRLKPDPAAERDPVQMTFNLATGAPVDEQQPPHGAVRFAIENPKDGEPVRMKIRWHYELQRMVEEAERISGKSRQELMGTLTTQVPIARVQSWKSPRSPMSTDPIRLEEAAAPALQSSQSSASKFDLVSDCRELGDWLEFPKDFRFDSRRYMELAGRLMTLAEPRRIDALRAMANDRLEGQTIALCRMLFESRPNAEFRGPLLGAAHFVGTTTKPEDWPLEPIALIGEVPLLIVEGYSLGGKPESAVKYLEYCLTNCGWTTRTFSEIEKGIGAADHAIRQPAFWGGQIDESEWREWADLRLQLRPSLVIEVKQQPWVNIVTPLYSVLDLGTWKVDEAIEKVKASGHGSDVPVTLIISDSARMEWIEPLVRELAEAGYRNQEHIWWQQSHEPVRKPELQQQLAFISAPIRVLEECWGPVDPKTGLRLRLTLSETSVPAGKPVLANLELNNTGDSVAEYDLQSFAPFRVVQITDEAGKAALFIGPRPQTSGSSLKLASGGLVKLWENVDLRELYLFDSGNYEVSILLDDRMQNLALESGPVRLKIEAGQLPLNLQFLKELRAMIPGGWGVSTGHGAIYLSLSPTNLKKDVTTIMLWFTEQQLPANYQLAEGDEQQQVTTIAPTELGFLHLSAPAKANDVWPDHIPKIKAAAARVFNFSSLPGGDGKRDQTPADVMKIDKTKKP